MKCDDPWDGYSGDDEPDECDHEHADVDVLIGLMSCSCGYRHWLSSHELVREAEIQTQMMEAYYAEQTGAGANG